MVSIHSMQVHIVQRVTLMQQVNAHFTVHLRNYFKIVIEWPQTYLIFTVHKNYDPAIIHCKTYRVKDIQ